MNAKLLDGVAARLADRAAAAIFSPAFAFLAVGYVAWAWSRGWNRASTDTTNWIAQRTTGEIVLIVVGGLIAIFILGGTVQAISAPVIRILEGYWPAWVLIDRPLRNFQATRFRRLDQQFNDAAAAAEASNAEENLLWTSTRAEDNLARYPVYESLLMPTRLGNTLRASEMRPFYKYGLDPVRCWHQLWLVLPEPARSEIVAARSRLEVAAVAFTFSISSAIWTLWAWWAMPLAVIASATTYRIYAIPAAENYGDLIEAACDIYRPDLFKALRLRLPTSPIRDQEIARFVNAYLQRGSILEDQIFLAPGD